MNQETHEQRRVSEHWTTREGVSILGADIDTRHLWNIARHLLKRVRRAREALYVQWELEGSEASIRELRHPYAASIVERVDDLMRTFCFVIDELEYRGALPTQDDLRVAWDRACACGAATETSEGIKGPHCFVELWVAFRGESTTTPEYLASLQEAAT